ncbi:SufE family protein [Conservatibacter flavescens]|uniref:Fe-S metabolism associated domain-containing protein n=1 Tax=Conservatibacter flavescens TaxID=28161 RepID=A0A2M8S5Y3_9PAST|nr:SufE family protein [Conservatibacter flavescens]PJG86567.1 hypothetical protein CVP05_01810 [Conservatibacter flavescens]
MKNELQQKLFNAKDWEERYRCIIQAAKNLPRPDEESLSQMQLIPGCEVKVWFKYLEKNNRTFQFYAYSESRIINGLLWIILLEIQDKSATQLREFSIKNYLSQLGIAQRLSASRLNGFAHIEKILQQL